VKKKEKDINKEEKGPDIGRRKSRTQKKKKHTQNKKNLNLCMGGSFGGGT